MTDRRSTRDIPQPENEFDTSGNGGNKGKNAEVQLPKPAEVLSHEKKAKVRSARRPNLRRLTGRVEDYEEPEATPQKIKTIDPPNIDELIK